jgi:hypothetical protein
MSSFSTAIYRLGERNIFPNEALVGLLGADLLGNKIYIFAK